MVWRADEDFGFITTAAKAEKPNTTALWIEWGAQRLREHTPTEKHAGPRGMEVAAPPLDLPSYRPVTYTGELIVYSKGCNGYKKDG